ncbi:hypothetical protein DRE_07735 [Drechslerella stenobrocha 248]|uniref:Uncharacterized protein n=1 Tax=Drechslerella stenobrocha 248 TaxID=1043628 RepID=W7HWI2_9PEZI|nr:hypothetical protein DRE_07735 [Drechslerella stenobrocha 248]
MGGSNLEARIYSEFHDVFQQGKAALRKPKVIQKTLEETEDIKNRLEAFCNDAGVSQDAVVDTIKVLLRERVFENPTIAKVRFPHIFQLSPVQLRERERWESEAAMSEAGAIAQSLQADNAMHNFDPPEETPGKDAVPEIVPPTTPGKRKKSVGKKTSVFNPPASEIGCVEDDAVTLVVDGTTKRLKLSTAMVVLPKENESAGSVEELPDVPETVDGKIPNLFPVYLPYPVQHRFTREAQRILEHVCYDFVKKWLPQKAQQEQFAHPENAELSMWARLIKKKLKELPATSHNKDALGVETIEKVVQAIENLRHTAVHRLKTQTMGLVNMLDKAVIFASFLKDERAEILRRMLHKAMELSTALEYEKILLQNKLRRELEEIEEARRVLERREKLALAQILVDDRAARQAVSFDMAELEAEPQPDAFGSPSEGNETETIPHPLAADVSVAPIGLDEEATEMSQTGEYQPYQPSLIEAILGIGIRGGIPLPQAAGDRASPDEPRLP